MIDAVVGVIFDDHRDKKRSLKQRKSISYYIVLNELNGLSVLIERW